MQIKETMYLLTKDKVKQTVQVRLDDMKKT